MYIWKPGESARPTAPRRGMHLQTAQPAVLALKRETSIHGLLELLQRQGPHGLRRRLRLEDARLLREGVDSLASGPRRLDLQLQLEVLGDLEGARLLQLAGANVHVRFHG